MVTSSRINTLDLLRGVAILGVICVHVSSAFPIGIRYLDTALGFGRFGVQLFFFVSALTMCHMWELRKDEANPAAKFYIRRFMRIVPLFWLAIPVYLLINGTGQSYWAPEGIGLHQVLLTATFLHGFWPDSANSVVPGGWTIAVEMTFYLVFPLLIAKIKDRGHYLYLAIAAYFLNIVVVSPLLAHLLAAHAIAQEQLIRDFLFVNFFNQAPVFLLGCYLYFQLKSGNGANASGTLLAFLAWVAAAAATGIILELPRTNLYFLLVILIEYGLVSLVLRARIQSSLLERLGKNSYAIYLSHFAVIGIVAWMLRYAAPVQSNAALLALGLVAVTLVSYIISVGSYHLLEKRVHAFAGRLTGDHYPSRASHLQQAHDTPS